MDPKNVVLQTIETRPGEPPRDCISCHNPATKEAVLPGGDIPFVARMACCDSPACQEMALQEAVNFFAVKA